MLISLLYFLTGATLAASVMTIYGFYESSLFLQSHGITSLEFANYLAWSIRMFLATAILNNILTYINAYIDALENQSRYKRYIQLVNNKQVKNNEDSDNQ